MRITALVAAGALLLAGCTGSADQKPAGDTPQDVLAHAKELLDDTSGVEVALTSSGLPDGASGVVLVGGSGTAVHPDSFKGTLQVRALGLTDSADVVAVGGKVWVKSSFLGPGFREVDLDTFGVPDPGTLLAPDGGVSSLLTSTEELAEGEAVRGGEDNAEVFTEYTGTLTGDQVQRIVPSADAGDYRVRYEISSDGRLQSAEITGAFYAGEPDVTYSIDIEAYDVTQVIKAP